MSFESELNAILANLSPHQKKCAQCGANFDIVKGDIDFYKKVKVPPPTWCSECRIIRRFLARNERTLYKRKCGPCGEMKIMMFSPDSPYIPYCYECYWSDNWDPMVYSRDFDPKRPFFEQFNELILAVPRPGIIKQGHTVNSEYVNRCSDSKDCYLVFGSIAPEKCLYSAYVNFSKDCLDCFFVQKSEKCYESIDCFGCYGLAFSKECDGCSDSWFLQNCRNCQSCFGCVNLRNKQYCFFNEQLSKDEYKAKIRALGVGSFSALEDAQERFGEHSKHFIVPWAVMHHATGSSGNWVQSSKNVRNAFGAVEVEEGAYLFNVTKAKDVMDFSQWGVNSERLYEAVNTGRQCSNLMFTNECWDQLIDSRYCMNCYSSSSNLFGCVGLRNKQYCILNKQYSKEEYEKLVERIRQHMDEMPYVDKKGRVYKYGEFFPPDFLPFAYNESIAQEYFPITKEAAQAQGFRWLEPQEKTYEISVAVGDLPDHIRDADDSLIEQNIGCAHEGKCNHQCTKAFRILREEMQIYRNANLPLPRLCPNCRHYQRLKQRNPLKLWHRSCQCQGNNGGQTSVEGVYQNTVQHFHGQEPCPNEFETSYAPERPEIVYCEECYKQEVV